MATVTLTPSDCTVDSGWTTLSYYGNSTGTRQLIFTFDVDEELAQSGVEINSITAHYYVRNSNSVAKKLRLGFKASASSAITDWELQDSAFTAAAASNGSTTVTTSGTRTMSADTFGEYITTQFQAGSAIYLGVIQPVSGRSIRVNPTLSKWTIDVEYEQTANIPTSDPEEAVIGETAITTTIERIIDDSTTTLRYLVNGELVDTVELGTDESYTWTPPESCGDYFPDSTEATLVIAADTYVDGELYGTFENEVALSLPGDASPTVDITPATHNDISGALVQGYSSVMITLSGHAYYGAGVYNDSSYSSTIESSTYTTVSFSHTFTTSGEVTLEVTVTDSRGLVGTGSQPFTVLPYSAPTISSFSITRVTEDGTEAIDGTYAQATLKASATSLTVSDTEANSLSAKVQYREISDDETDWIDSDTVAMSDISGTWTWMLTADGTAIGGGDPFNDMSGYEFKCVVSDLIGTATALDSMPTKEQFWDIDEDTGKMGFGGDAPNEDETASYRFHGAVDVAGALTAESAAIEDIPFGWHAGDAIELETRMIFSAFLSGSTKVLCVGIPLGMPVYADGFSISGGFIARGIDGYLNSASDGIDLSDSTLTVDCYIANARAGLIYVRVESASAFTNASNNTPVALEFTTGTTITFA